jgi:hypothetical protein
VEHTVSVVRLGCVVLALWAIQMRM